MRIAVVGLGFMGATHARAWTKVPGAELYAVVSGDERKRAGEIQDSGGNLDRGGGALDLSRVKAYRTYEEALSDPAVEAVDLCVPTDRHAEMTIHGFRTGKHVLVEKPMALSVLETERMLLEADRCGRVLMCGQVLRFFPAYAAARDHLAQLGPIRAAAFRRRCATPAWSAWLSDPRRSGGGAFDLLVHDADYVRWIFGMPENVRAWGTWEPNAGIDLVTARLSYQGFYAEISGGWYGPGTFPFSMDFTIAGEHGAIEFREGALTFYPASGTPEQIGLTAGDPFEAELAHFHECAELGRPSEICPPEQSGDSVRLMRAILESRQASAD